MTKEERKVIGGAAEKHGVVQDCAIVMIKMQRMLHEVGLHGTARAINIASQKLGWEAAALSKRRRR